jgi:Fe-S oxidoreductase
MYRVENVIFALIFAVAVGIFLISAIRLIRLVSLGGPDGRLHGSIARRIKTMFVYAFFQKRVVSEKFGINHSLLFWGFLVLLLANAEFVVSGLFPTASLRVSGPIVYPLLSFFFDLVSLLVIGCVAVAVVRRVFVRPTHIDALSGDAFLILGLVAGLMIAFFALNGGEIALQEKARPFFMPLSEHLAAPAMAAIFGAGLPTAVRVFWWIHALIFLGFLNYLPYSKHIHILGAIPDCFCRSFEPVSTLPRESFSVGRSYGVSRVDEFTWKDLLDFLACTECGRCNANCPATLSGKTLNPRYVIHDGKVNLFKNGVKILYGNRTDGLLPLMQAKDETEGSVGEESIWACTTCGACMANCPVFIEHVPKILKMRRSLVQNRAQFPPELNIFFEAIEQRSNPWGIIPADRGKWARDLDVPLLSAAPEEVEILFYVGCAGAFDSRSKKVAASVVKILKAAGVSFGILGAEELCCGDSLRRLGNEYVFEEMAKKNLELFQKYKFKKILTYCPHCYTTLKNDYRQFGFDLPVIHQSEFIHDLLKSGRLKLHPAEGAGRVIFHDSCYLGRYNEIYDPPREIVAAATGHKPMEFDRMHQKSFCCGAGGGRMWMEESPEHRLNLNRVSQALAKKPDTVAVCCPYCMTMFEDGLKDEKATQVQVMDIAEIVAAGIDSK